MPSLQYQGSNPDLLRATHFLDFPNEILSMICENADLVELRKLVQLCKRLNTVGMPIYLAGLGIFHPTLTSVYLSPHTFGTLWLVMSPIQLAHSLNCRFFSPSDDIRAFRQLVLNSPSLQEMSLEFHESYNADFGEAQGTLGGDCLSGVLRDILDQSFAVGCNSLAILGGNTNGAGPEQPQTEQESSSSGQGDTSCSPLGRLKRVKIESAMMLSYPLIDRTMQILGSNPHISDLSLDSDQFPFEKWCSILCAITFPCLRNFSVTVHRCEDDLPDRQRDTVRDILSFVSRHPTIAEFCCRDPFNPTGVDRPSNMLTALESLEAQPSYVEYLLQMPDALPNLRHVTVYIPTPAGNLAPLSRALAAIRQRSADLTLCFKFRSITGNLFSWFASGGGQAPDARVERTLHCVKRLEFHTRHAIHAVQLASGHQSSAFLAWLSLFPDLRFFEIDKGSLTHMSQRALGSFVKVLIDHCPKLEAVKLEGEERDIPTWFSLASQFESDSDSDMDSDSEADSDSD